MVAIVIVVKPNTIKMALLIVWQFISNDWLKVYKSEQMKNRLKFKQSVFLFFQAKPFDGLDRP